MSLPDNIYEFCLLLKKYERKRITKSELEQLNNDIEQNGELKKLFTKVTGSSSPKNTSTTVFASIWIPVLLTIVVLIGALILWQTSATPNNEAINHPQRSALLEQKEIPADATINTDLEVETLRNPNVEIMGLEQEIQMKMDQMLTDPSSEFSNFELPQIGEIETPKKE